jgi:predicted lipoprotein with Yx(FWY)xxD motif
MITPKQLALYLAGIVVLIAAAAAGLALAAGSAIDIKSKDGVGSYLADSKGMTLYVFQNDPADKSACAGMCAQNWPVFYTGAVTVPDGLDATKFGTITREDGKTQTTYKGMPLYYFVQDKAPGDTKGHGLKGVWSAASP